MQRTLYGPTKYVSRNETEASEAWDAILAGHGIVAVTSEFKDQQDLHETLIHPNGTGYYIYGLEAYHAMHCVVRILRSSWIRLVDSESRRIYAPTTLNWSKMFQEIGLEDTTSTALMLWGNTLCVISMTLCYGYQVTERAVEAREPLGQHRLRCATTGMRSETGLKLDLQAILMSSLGWGSDTSITITQGTDSQWEACR